MTYLLLLITNEVFYLSIFSVFLIFYGVEKKFFQKKKQALYLVFFGTLLLAIVLVSTFFQYSNFKSLAINNYKQSTEGYEDIATNPSIKIEMRLNAAQNIYVIIGKSAIYLNAKNELTSYVATDIDKKQRTQKVEEDKFLTRSITNNLLICKLLLVTIIISLTVGGLAVFFRQRE